MIIREEAEAWQQMLASPLWAHRNVPAPGTCHTNSMYPNTKRQLIKHSQLQHNYNKIVLLAQETSSPPLHIFAVAGTCQNTLNSLYSRQPQNPAHLPQPLEQLLLFSLQDSHHFVAVIYLWLHREPEQPAPQLADALFLLYFNSLCPTPSVPQNITPLRWQSLS